MGDPIGDALRQAYERRAAERDVTEAQRWKLEQRDRFLRLLQERKKQSLLEIGSGPGRDGLFFKQQGLTVTCIDLTPKMIALCREKGLDARVMDLHHLEFSPRSFDAVYALNSLLHVQKAKLPQVLQGIRRVMREDGLFFMGVYGGREFEGVWEDDTYRPKRYFSLYPDDVLEAVIAEVFTVESFTRVDLERRHDDSHFQAFILRKT